MPSTEIAAPSWLVIGAAPRNRRGNEIARHHFAAVAGIIIRKCSPSAPHGLRQRLPISIISMRRVCASAARVFERVKIARKQRALACVLRNNDLINAKRPCSYEKSAPQLTNKMSFFLAAEMCWPILIACRMAVCAGLLHDLYQRWPPRAGRANSRLTSSCRSSGIMVRAKIMLEAKRTSALKAYNATRREAPP